MSQWWTREFVDRRHRLLIVCADCDTRICTDHMCLYDFSLNVAVVDPQVRRPAPQTVYIVFWLWYQTCTDHTCFYDFRLNVQVVDPPVWLPVPQTVDIVCWLWYQNLYWSYVFIWFQTECPSGGPRSAATGATDCWYCVLIVIFIKLVLIIRVSMISDWMFQWWTRECGDQRHRLSILCADCDIKICTDDMCLYDFRLNVPVVDLRVRRPTPQTVDIVCWLWYQNLYWWYVFIWFQTECASGGPMSAATDASDCWYCVLIVISNLYWSYVFIWFQTECTSGGPTSAATGATDYWYCVLIMISKFVLIICVYMISDWMFQWWTRECGDRRHRLFILCADCDMYQICTDHMCLYDFRLNVPVVDPRVRRPAPQTVDIVCWLWYQICTDHTCLYDFRLNVPVVDPRVRRPAPQTVDIVCRLWYLSNLYWSYVFIWFQTECPSGGPASAATGATDCWYCMLIVISKFVLTTCVYMISDWMSQWWTRECGDRRHRLLWRHPTLLSTSFHRNGAGWNTWV